MNDGRRQREGAPRRADARDGRRRHDAPQGARARARAHGRGSRREAARAAARDLHEPRHRRHGRDPARGVDALREERFVYPQPEPSFSRTLAHAYVTRGRWGKGVAGSRRRGRRRSARVPAVRARAGAAPGHRSAGRAHRGVREPSTRTPTTRPRSTPRARSSRRAKPPSRRATSTPRARRRRELETLNARVKPQYELRVVSRPGETSGLWREPEVNRGARNYYLVVEAIAPNGEALRLPITSEEDQRTRGVRAWGLARRRSDVRACGRRQAATTASFKNNVVGRKRRGVLEREYTVPTTGAAITEW